MNNVGKIAGRLKYFLNNWKEFTSDARILEWVEGLKITFCKKVEQDKTPIPKVLSEIELVQMKNAIGALLAKGAIEPCKPCKNQFLSSYFLVPKPDNSARFILNLKKLN